MNEKKERLEFTIKSLERIFDEPYGDIEEDTEVSFTLWDAVKARVAKTERTVKQAIDEVEDIKPKSGDSEPNDKSV